MYNVQNGYENILLDVAIAAKKKSVYKMHNLLARECMKRVTYHTLHTTTPTSEHTRFYIFFLSADMRAGSSSERSRDTYRFTARNSAPRPFNGWLGSRGANTRAWRSRLIVSRKYVPGLGSSTQLPFPTATHSETYFIPFVFVQVRFAVDLISR